MCFIRVTAKLHADDNVDKSAVTRITKKLSHYSHTEKCEKVVLDEEKISKIM